MGQRRKCGDRPELPEETRVSLRVRLPLHCRETRLNWKKAPPMLDQSPSPSMPATTASKCTTLESTTNPDAAHCPWTTQSWLSDTELKVDRTTGSSRTAGEPPGERRDTSRCPGTRTITAE